METFLREPLNEMKNSLCFKLMCRLTASVCTGCAAKSTPARVANGGLSRATARPILVKSMQATTWRATFVKWNHMGRSPNNR